MAKKTEPYIITWDDITVTVTPKRVKRLNLRVTAEGEIHMSTPLGYAPRLAEVFVGEKLAWIRMAMDRMEKKQEYTASRCEDGAAVRLFGEELTLVIRRGQRESGVEGNTLCLGVGHATPTQYEAYLDKYLRARLAEVVEGQMAAAAVRIGVRPSAYYLRRMKTRWGSCNTRTGRIAINLNLVHYPLACVEYVVIHELCHLREPSHNARFWQLVGTYCPTYRTAQKQLKM